MPINYIPNDPSAASPAPSIRVQPRRPNRPFGRAGFTFSRQAPEGRFNPGTPQFLFWQCREGALAALEAWEAVAGNLTSWQGNRRRLALRQDSGEDLNAFYDRFSFSFFHQRIGGTTFFSGASTDVVAHEIGHGLLDAIRPDLWDAAFLEAGAFHEAFGDCIAVLTALHDRETRVKLLSATSTLRRKNFVESTAENLARGIRLLAPNHNAAEVRHAFNTFQFQLPETLPMDGGPGELINEVHSFGMLFSGCFYDLIAGIFASRSAATEGNLLAAVRTAGSLLMAGAASAVITPRFFQSVGRAMELADDRANGGANRPLIRRAFQGHNIMLGANALLAPKTVLAGRPPSLDRAASVGASTRRDLAARLGVSAGTRPAIRPVELSGRRFAQVVHTQRVALGSVDRRLRGVTMPAAMPVLVGASGGRAAVIGDIPEPVSTEQEVHAFVASLVKHGQIEFGGAAARGAAARAGAPSRRKKPMSAETHRVVSSGRARTLERVRFNCGCGIAGARGSDENR
jgi:hypothetical protein